MNSAEHIARSGSLPRAVRTASALSLLAALALLSGASPGAPAEGKGFLAESAAKKTKPCSNKKQKVFVLCKPRAGTWGGVATQQTPSGPESSPLQLAVSRQGARNNGTRVGVVDPSLRWFCGDTPLPMTTDGENEPHLESARAGKKTGIFDLHGGLALVESRKGIDLFGDFVNKTRAKGTITGTWSNAPQGICPGGIATLRTVTWTASFAGAS